MYRWSLRRKAKYGDSKEVLGQVSVDGPCTTLEARGTFARRAYSYGRR
jgi:hypothetical protein